MIVWTNMIPERICGMCRDGIVLSGGTICEKCRKQAEFEQQSLGVNNVSVASEMVIRIDSQTGTLLMQVKKTTGQAEKSDLSITPERRKKRKT